MPSPAATKRQWGKCCKAFIIKVIEFHHKKDSFPHKQKEKDFTRESVIELYFRRWAVEEYYRDEKVYLEVETFHSKNCNGIPCMAFC